MKAEEQDRNDARGTAASAWMSLSCLAIARPGTPEKAQHNEGGVCILYIVSGGWVGISHFIMHNNRQDDIE